MLDENKDVVRRFFAEVINAPNPDQADGFVTANYIEHQRLPGAEGRQGIEIAKAFLAMMRVAFPDYRFALEDLIAEGDKVVARLTVSGTHLGEMMGLAPTRQQIQISGIEVFRLEAGKLAEHWATFDTLGMLQQVGLRPIPTPRLLVRTVTYQVRKRLRRTKPTTHLKPA
jgi:predicted ester cyclase